ncbi:MAG: hypothetical protein H6709_21305 [Kofleriaceae bacterium]|nr:hypothetical protein [Myxococcales bacterium]MCB9561655.1 hypothetical protein [Kofleriaceae bacterium]MCB9574622.1 hypothetical protein [Kofleriaceae bacterium]
MTHRTRLSSLLVASTFAALTLLGACGTTTRFVATNPSPHPLVAKPASAVHVYTTGVPEVPYVEVGILQSRQSSSLSTHDMPEIIASMRAEAGKLGCDGVIINGAADKTEGSSSVVDDGNSTTYSSSQQTLEGFWGACIVYLDGDATPAVAPGAPGATATR